MISNTQMSVFKFGKQLPDMSPGKVSHPSKNPEWDERA